MLSRICTILAVKADQDQTAKDMQYDLSATLSTVLFSMKIDFKITILNFEGHVTVSQASPGFYVPAVEVF